MSLMMMNLFPQVLRGGLVILALLILCCIFRAFRGPEAADRLVAVNMITTLVTIGVCVLAFLMKEGFLSDVALIFSLIGCLAAVVLTRVVQSRDSGKAPERKVGGHVE